MDQFHNAMEMLDLIMPPAFCVHEGRIVKVNSAAAALLIETGADIQSLLHTGAEEYAAFPGGCLYLTLSVAGQNVGASVTRMEVFDVFCLEQETDSQLQALALAARELREPLANLMIIADRAFPETCSDDDKAQEQVSHMNRSLFQMLRILNNMSDAQAYAAGTDSRQEVRNICAVLDEIFCNAATLTGHTAVSLQYTGLAESIYTPVDVQKLERMVFNILSNAIKFTPSEGTIDAKLTRREKKLYLSVCDSGSGVAEQVKSSLFTRYLREAGLEDRRYGLGLGMVLIRSIAAQHGGTVLVEHPENSGTRVTVSFAIRPGDATLRSPRLRVDYTGERDHGLVELSDVLPARLYDPESVS